MKSIYHFLLENIPRKYLIRLSFLFTKISPFLLKGDKVFCPVCKHSFKKFLSYGVEKRENVLCPKCLSLERHRLLNLFLEEKTDFFRKKQKMLHIAPEQCFYTKFKKQKNLEYITADLESPIADVKMDIQKMPFKNNEFDVLFCNHVLEHIEDDKKAMSEVLRVLKKGGFAILQVPIENKLKKTYEDKSITEPLEREKHFLQKDHLRLYGLDYPKRLESVGFKVKEENLIEKLSEELIEKYRLDKTEIIYFCKKI